MFKFTFIKHLRYIIVHSCFITFSRYIFVSSSTALFMFVVLVPSYFTAARGSQQAAILSFCLILISCITIICQYVPRLYAIFFINETTILFAVTYHTHAANVMASSHNVGTLHDNNISAIASGHQDGFINHHTIPKNRRTVSTSTYTGSLQPRNGSNSSYTESVKPLNGSAGSQVGSNKLRIESTSSCVGSTDHAQFDGHYTGSDSPFTESVSHRDESDNHKTKSSSKHAVITTVIAVNSLNASAS